MSEISKAYEPQSVEPRWYQFWLDEKLFVADAASKKPAYTIVIPPPNITGSLHLGHVLNNTVQDILARKARMEGKEVLWLPGTDHASIATHMVLERKLKKEEHITRYDLGREKFIERAWEWRKQYGGIIIGQLKKLGCSCDWTRERFTMDPEYSRCVQKVFVELYKKGLIYRGKRMVNWCPATQTALSDEEVIMKEQKGLLYYFKVEVAGHPLTPALSPGGGEGEKGKGSPLTPTLSPNGGEGDGKAGGFGPVTDAEGRVWLTIATTRPDTIPGDTAVAVNPKDPRYAHLIGKQVIRALPPELTREQRLIPIVGDESVDFEFGTGVLKVTPAHDKTDFEIGLRHKLAVIEVINADGTMSDAAGVDMKGLDRFKARKIAVEKLKELGALEKEEPYTNKVGYSERADVPIEPRLSEQWFLKYPSVEEAKACVEQEERSAEHRSAQADEGDSRSPACGTPRSGKMRFHPQRWAKVYDHWLADIRDWCISRQLWWGHRIPVWTLTWGIKGEDSKKWDQQEMLGILEEWLAQTGIRGSVFLKPISDYQVLLLTTDFSADVQLAELSSRFANYSPSSDEVYEQNHPIAGHLLHMMAGLEQDPDVLDTWFSSWLWPFATMGWPEQTETLKKFYPTTDLVTGPDIIFFWVARMIMAGYEFMGDLPFQNVYFTGIIRDKQGRKMSKVLGNSPNPLDLIAKYGADALRFGVMRSAPLGQDVLFDEKDVELGRNFCNKLWNACRFRQMVGSTDIPIQGEINPQLLTGDDKWILLKLNLAIRELTESLAEYKFSEAAQTLYRFFWSEYCDWYVEATKAVLGKPPEAGQTPPLPGPLPPAAPGGEGEERKEVAPNAQGEVRSAEQEARKANTIAVIDFVLSHTLRLFHPFLPFISEELWHGMGYHEDMPADQGGRSIMFAPWPKAFDEDFRGHYGLDDCYLEFADQKYELVTLGRNLRREANIAANKKVKFVLKPIAHVTPHDAAVLKILLNAETLEIDPNHAPQKGTPAVNAKLGDLYLPTEGLIDVAAEKARLTKELEKIDGEIVKVEQKLANPAFVQKVPPGVLLEHQQRLADWQTKRQQVLAALRALEG